MDTVLVSCGHLWPFWASGSHNKLLAAVLRIHHRTIVMRKDWKLLRYLHAPTEDRLWHRLWKVTHVSMVVVRGGQACYPALYLSYQQFGVLLVCYS